MLYVQKSNYFFRRSRSIFPFKRSWKYTLRIFGLDVDFNYRLITFNKMFNRLL